MLIYALKQRTLDIAFISSHLHNVQDTFTNAPLTRIPPSEACLQAPSVLELGQGMVLCASGLAVDTRSSVKPIKEVNPVPTDNISKQVGLLINGH